jgi:hypothetical protein
MFSAACILCPALRVIPSVLPANLGFFAIKVGRAGRSWGELGEMMERRARMSGLRLGFTYPAAIVFLGLLTAMLNVAPAVDGNATVPSENTAD